MSCLLLGIFSLVFGLYLISFQDKLKKTNPPISQIPNPTSTVLGVQNTSHIKVEKGLESAGFCLSVPVLLYHHIEPIEQAKTEGHSALTVDVNIFDSQMKYLKDKGYRSISAEDLVNAIVSHKSVGKAAVVTLDDGYKDAYDFAYPVAKKYGIVLNLMIPTGLLNNSNYMSWDNLREMVNSGMVNAYDHTWSHYSLPNGNVQKIEMEVMTAKNQLEQNLGKKVNIFSYPYGSNDQKTVNILQKNGFIGAFSTIPSFYQCESYIYALRRNRIGNASLSSYGL